MSIEIEVDGSTHMMLHIITLVHTVAKYQSSPNTKRQYSFDNFDKYDGSNLARSSMELALKWSALCPKMPYIGCTICYFNEARATSMK